MKDSVCKLDVKVDMKENYQAKQLLKGKNFCNA